MLPTSLRKAPLCRITFGILNEPPISTSSLDTITSARAHGREHEHYCRSVVVYYYNVFCSRELEYELLEVVMS